MSLSTRRFVALLAAVSIVIAACGGDDASADTTSTTTPGSTTPSTTAAAAPDTTAGGGEGEALVAQSGDFVRVHYVGTLDSGEQFDSSRDRGATLDFTVGSGQMISGFDAAVRGMAVGETKTVRLAPADAYGERSDDAIVEIPAASLPEGTEVGQTLFTASGSQVIVVAIEGDTATIDANPRLAGEFLTFEIEMVAIER